MPGKCYKWKHAVAGDKSNKFYFVTENKSKSTIAYFAIVSTEYMMI